MDKPQLFNNFENAWQDLLDSCAGMIRAWRAGASGSDPE